MTLTGNIDKMRIEPAADGVAVYHFRVADQAVALNPHLGETLRIEFDGAISCVHCGRATKKSFSQGYCYPCFTRLAQCDSCVMAPERCHYEQGTCREPEWGETHCMQPHVVYLANTTGIKVGITRAGQVPTRWLDQGAVQALPFARTATRQQAGFVEDLLRGSVSDRTQWQRLLKGDAPVIDLQATRKRLADDHAEGLAALTQRFGLQAITLAAEAEEARFRYPVLEYPTKVTSLNPEKTPVVEGCLMGIKGQYLIFDIGVINVRKYTAYSASFTAR